MNPGEDKFLERMLVFSTLVLLLTGAYFIFKAPKTLSQPIPGTREKPYTGFFSSSSDHGGRASSTRACMQNIKTALVNFCNDLGFFPHIGTTRVAKNYYLAEAACLGASVTRNVLIASDVGSPFELGGLTPENYSRRWKGPYMDCDPSEFMFDAWDNKIIYTFFRDGIFLHSSGANGIFDSLDHALEPSYKGDDIVLRVTKLRKF